MNLSDIKQWIVSADKLARPINPFDYDSTVEYTAYERFATFANQNTYATDLEPGIYDGDKVEVVWQYLTKKGVWFNYNEQDAFGGSYSRYRVYMIEEMNCVNTRQFLRLKQQPKEPEIKILAESLCAHCGGNVRVVQIGESVIDITKQPLNPNANAIKVLSDRIEQLKAIIGGDTEYDERSHIRLDEANHILKLLQS